MHIHMFNILYKKFFMKTIDFYQNIWHNAFKIWMQRNAYRHIFRGMHRVFLTAEFGELVFWYVSVNCWSSLVVHGISRNLWNPPILAISLWHWCQKYHNFPKILSPYVIFFFSLFQKKAKKKKKIALNNAFSFA